MRILGPVRRTLKHLNFSKITSMEKLSYLSLEPHLKSLRLCGCYALGPDSLKWKKYIHTIYMRFVLLFISLYTFQQIIKVSQVRDDADKAMGTIFLLLTNSDATYKQVVFWKKFDEIESLIAIMKGPIFNQPNKEHKAILSQTVRNAKLVLRGFNIAALITCLLWILYPVVLYLQGLPVEFAIWLPFDTSVAPNFHLVIVYVWIQTSWLAFNNTSMDSFIWFLLAQAKTQLSILRLDLENVVQKSKEEAKCLSMPYHIIYRKRFNDILLHYNEIMQFSTTIQSIFGGALLYQFLVGGWIICTTAYRTVNINPASLEFIPMILYMACIVVELFLYCHYGHELNWESECILHSAYTIDWLEIPINYRKDLILFMERIKRPVRPMAGTFIPLSNSTFISIMRSSYSFYAFLKQSN